MKRSITTLLASFTLLVAAPVWAQNTTPAPKADRPAAVQPGTKLTPKIDKQPAQKLPVEEKADNNQADNKQADDKADEAGPNHKLLAQFEGEWQTVTTEFGEDGKPASTDKGTTTAKMVMGGRFLEFSYDGRSHGKFAKGSGMIGFSNAEKRFEQYYAQSTSTEIESMNGTADVAGKVFTLTGKTTDAATGKAVSKKAVITFTSKDSLKEEIFVTVGGKETKVAELAYTRESKAPKKQEKPEFKTKPAPGAAPANKK